MKEIKVNGMLGVHCENGDLVDELINHMFLKESYHYHPLSRPAAVEAEAVARYLMIAEMADCRLILCI